MRIEVNPSILNWAIERSAKDIDQLAHKFPNLLSWQNKTKQPTFKQLEKFAEATYIPIGMLFLPEPPQEVLPINDFRTFTKNNNPIKPSVNLLDTIYSTQQKQHWYKAYCKQQDIKPIEIVGKYTIKDNPKVVAENLNRHFSFHNNFSSWQQALAGRIALIEKQNILVMSSGVALGNVWRNLEIEEFRGFALSDTYASIIFINAKDSVAARNFTLMHELAHIAIAEDGVSNTNSYNENSNAIEQWCDKVAAEILVPSEVFKQEYRHDLNNLEANLQDFARYFRVSTLVILGRIYDLQYVDKKTFWKLFLAEKAKLIAILQKETSKKGGGDYYNTKPASISPLFMKTVTASTLEGGTLYRDAMRLLHVKNIDTYHKLASKAHPWMS